MSSAVWDKVVGRWNQIKGDIRTRWGKLTNDDLEQVAGQRDKLVGKIQERYGIAKEQANREIDEWADKLKV